MVNLPTPSALSSSSGIEVLSKAGPSVKLLDALAPTRSYSFGLTTLPGVEAIQDNELRKTLEQLFELSQLLIVPSPFGRGNGQAWTHSEQLYPALLQWKRQQVPGLLSRVAQLLKQLDATNNSTGSIEDTSVLILLVLGHVVCALARYLFLEPLDLAPSQTPSSVAVEAPRDDGWTDETIQSKARSALNGLSRSVSTRKHDTPTLAKSLLTDYIKPIFSEVASSSSASMSSIDPATGRKKAPAPGSAFISHLNANLGQHRFQSVAEDSDALNLAPRRFALALSVEYLRSTVVEDVASLSDSALQGLTERNEALGCINVLSWCLDNLQQRTESEWSSVWPLLVPPLLTLLEHPQPKFRLRGSMLVHKFLLRPSLGGQTDGSQDGRTREVVVGRILVRTGIGSLLERALHSNLTYVHDEKYAAGLLFHSIGALRRLILLTTYPIAWRDSSQPLFETPYSAEAGYSGSVSATLDQPDDCGKRRMEALSRLVSEGILSTWSYLPLPPSSTRLGCELVKVTCSAYMVLANDLAAPVLSENAGTEAEESQKGTVALGGVARFLDVTLDWIFRSWLSNVAFDHTDQIVTTTQVLDVACRLLFPSLSGAGCAEDAGKKEHYGNFDVSPSSVHSFTGIILLSVAKCWISALESSQRTSTVKTEASGQARWQELQRRLTQLMANLSLVDSSVQPRWTEMVKVDQRLAALFQRP
ncbi:uncharacterized protein UHOD_02181 [Ustilago sp. UG-2017b]|nr:uncharacterized protein UHOD_02181 [Ustilago sp. UG-2017b]